MNSSSRFHRGRTPRILAVTAAALSALLLGGCATGAAASAPSDAGTPVQGGTLKLAFWPDNPNLTSVDPFQVYWIETRSVLRNVVDSLTDQDPKTGKLVPWLASSWEVNADSTQFTFHLRSGVTFSDGSAFTADSVKLAFDNDAATVKAIPSTYGASYLAGYTGTTVVDPSTVQVNFSRPSASFLQATSTTNLGILAASSYAKTPQQRSKGEIVGSGLFTLDSYDPTKGIELSRRADYAWGSSLNTNRGAAHLEHVSVSYVSEDSVRLGQLTSGAIDIDWPRNQFSAADQKLVSASGLSLVERSLPGISNPLFANVTDGHVLQDLAVRQALQKAIDRASYAATIYGPKYPVVQGVYDSSTPFFVSQAASLGYDVAGAKKLLTDDGWTLGSDGYFTKAGQELTLDYPTSTTAAGDQLLQDQLKKAGIKLNIRVETAALWAQDRAAGKYDLGIGYYTRADPTVLQSVIDTRYAPTAKNVASPTQQAKIQELFDAGLQSTSNDARAAAYSQLQAYLIGGQELAFPISERVQEVALSPKVHGFRFTSESFLTLNDLWLSK